MLEREPERLSFDGTSCQREVFEVADRNGRNPVALLWLREHEPLLYQAGQTFTDDARTRFVTPGQHREPEFGSRPEFASDDVAAHALIHLFAAGSSCRRHDHNNSRIQAKQT